VQNNRRTLFNRKGEVIGIVTATLDEEVTFRTSGSLPQNVNFVVKLDYVLPAIRSALSNGVLEHPADSRSAALSTLVRLREPSVVLVVAE